MAHGRRVGVMPESGGPDGNIAIRGFRSDDLHVCRHDFSKLHPDPRSLPLFLFDPGEFIMFKLMGKLR